MGEMLGRGYGRCVGVIGVDCVLLSVEESDWKNCTDCVMDVAVVEDVDFVCGFVLH